MLLIRFCSFILVGLCTEFLFTNHHCCDSHGGRGGMLVLHFAAADETISDASATQVFDI